MVDFILFVFTVFIFFAGIAVGTWITKHYGSWDIYARTMLQKAKEKLKSVSKR